MRNHWWFPKRQISACAAALAVAMASAATAHAADRDTPSWGGASAATARPADHDASSAGTVSAATTRAADDDEPSSSAVRASSDGAYLELAEQGLVLYKAQRYRRAAEKFLQAYAVEQDPNLLFNVARCYEALGDTAAALEKYEAYLRAPNIETTGRERAEKAVRALREQQNDKAVPPSRAGKSTQKAESRAAPAPADHGDTKVVVGWVVTAVLAAGTTVAGVWAVDSAKRLRTARDVFPGHEKEIDKLSTRTLTLSVTADALGVATALMGGITLYWTVTSSSSRPEIKAGSGPTGFRLVGSF